MVRLAARHQRDTDWFGDKWTSLLVICLAEIWKTTPFISLLLLAGLAQVPDVLQEAAMVDGATWGSGCSRSPSRT